MARTLGLMLILLAPPQQQRDGVIAAGAENWEKPWMPDLRDPSARVPIPLERRIDVLILGDGYLPDERKEFEDDVQEWYDGFLKLIPWCRFKGAFRVRGLWTPGEGRATPDRRSYYGLPATALGVGDAGAPGTRRAIFEAIERTGCNRTQSGGLLTHTVVVMLVKNEFGRGPSGMSRALPSPDGRRSVGVAFSAYTHHEFDPAYGGLRDEYIMQAGSKANRKPPARLSMRDVLNLSYTRELKMLPWAHLSPGSPLNPDRNSVVGVLWIGGIAEEGVWHSEARCLMNGSHDNWDLARTKRGVSLRDRSRFCFWCEEILAAKTLYKTGMLGDSEDGAAAWNRWETQFRPLYHRAFDVPGRIRERNAENAKARLQEAKIYERPVVSGPD